MVWRNRNNFIQESNFRQRVLGNTNPVKSGKEYGNGGTKLTANLPQALDGNEKTQSYY